MVYAKNTDDTPGSELPAHELSEDALSLILGGWQPIVLEARAMRGTVRPPEWQFADGTLQIARDTLASLQNQFDIHPDLEPPWPKDPPPEPDPDPPVPPDLEDPFPRPPTEDLAGLFQSLRG
ncbi:MAG: hypothetical protein ABW217_22575 [Polyangiaceae bacterium]